MRKLFYSKTEKILFYVAGYTDNSDNVEKIIEMLNRGRDNLAKLIPEEEKSNIKTLYVDKSSRYKYTRVFFVETTTMPENAFVINNENGWTMRKWLEN